MDSLFYRIGFTIRRLPPIRRVKLPPMRIHPPPPWRGPLDPETKNWPKLRVLDNNFVVLPKIATSHSVKTAGLTDHKKSHGGTSYTYTFN